MSDSKDKKKTQAKPDDFGRKIWLAGLGAYGQSIDNMQSSVEKVNNETREFFEKLVARGEELESTTRKTISETREKTNSRLKAQSELIASKAEKIQSLTRESLSLDKLKPENLGLDHLTENINGRLDDIRNKISHLVPGMVTREDIEKLSDKIDKLAAAADKPRRGRAPKAAKPADKSED